MTPNDLSSSIVLSASRSLCGVLLLSVLSILAACESTGPKNADSSPLVPSAYRNSSPLSTAVAVLDAQWWTQYGSMELDRLVDRALANNNDLRIAILQVMQAQIRAEQSRSGRLPSLSAPVRVANQSQGSTSDSQQNSQLVLNGTYRVDLWGEQRALVDSADMQLQRAIHERENVQRNVIASVVTSYIAYLSLSDSIQLAKENEAIVAEVLEAIELRLKLGDATLTEVEQQRSVFAQQQTLRPSLESQREEARNTLSRMVGGLPDSLNLTEQGLDTLQTPLVREGLPSALLFARPDIRMVEARMRAADANIALARARILPSLDLSGQMGYASASIASLFQPQSLLVTTVGALAATIFDGGQRRGEKAFAESYYEEMLETYAKTVLQAVREVEGALAALRAAHRRVDAQKAATRAALNIYKHSHEALSVGAIDRLTLLEQRRQYQRSADESQRMKSELLRGYANLAYAVGLGSVLAVDANPTDKDSLQGGGDVMVREEQGNPRLTIAFNKPDDRVWSVELSGVFHRSALVPLWRDLQHRMRGSGEGIWVHGLLAGQVTGDAKATEAAEAWYRVHVSGFKDREFGLNYCTKLQRAGQTCKVIGGGSG